MAGLHRSAMETTDERWRRTIMSQTTTARGDLFAQVLDPANRPNPYPLYAQLRETPVALQDDGTYVVSTYREIIALLHDPRISSDERKSARGAGALAASGRLMPAGQPGNPAFIFLDPPDHDRLRRLVMHQFTPERIGRMRDEVARLVGGLLDAQRDRDQLDIVDDLAYPLPVTVICELLGVPREDEPRFHGWATALARSLDPAQGMSEEEVRQAAQAALQMLEYLGGLVAARRAHPADDLLSGLVAGDDPAGRMDERELLSTIALLLIAGHETTVNLITNGMLTLLRHPDVLDRLRREPDLVITLVEEVLRRTRTRPCAAPGTSSSRSTAWATEIPEAARRRHGDPVHGVDGNLLGGRVGARPRASWTTLTTTPPSPRRDTTCTAKMRSCASTRSRRLPSPASPSRSATSWAGAATPPLSGGPPSRRRQSVQSGCTG
jgi:cytochrome P450